MTEDDLLFYEDEQAPRQASIKLPRLKNLADITLYEDDDFIVLNKPPYISTLDERAAGFGEGLLRFVKRTLPKAQAGHRLDKETSGVIVFAKHSAAYRHIAMQFEHRQITKIYHAVVHGVHAFEGVQVLLPILLMNGGYVTIDKQKGKEAETVFNTQEVFRRHTLVTCYPITGRMHQIRIHLKALEASIVSDPRYGGPLIYLSDIKRKHKQQKGIEELPLISRVALHAAEINFAKMDGERIHVQAPYAKDFEALLHQLRKGK